MSDDRAAQIERYNAFIRECEIFIFCPRDSDLQKETCSKLQTFLTELQNEKRAAVTAQDEDLANMLLGYERVATCLHAEITMWLLLKSQEPDGAWDNLVSAQMAAADAARAHPGFHHLLQRAERLEAIEQLVFPPKVFVSAGLIVRRQECSICAAEYGDCAHLIGRPYWGEFCYIIPRDIEVDHVALVTSPADKRCRILHFASGGGERNRMTWKINRPEGDMGSRTDEPDVEQLHATAIIRDLSRDQD